MANSRCVLGILALCLAACAPQQAVTQNPAAATGAAKPAGAGYLGFDRNLYPGDQTLPAVAKRFAFTGYWLNNPPGERSNTWAGKRELIKSHGLGFLVLWNGRLDQEILGKAKQGTSATSLGKADAHDAVQATKREGFPAGSILFLDQEEGGRLLPEQADYLFAWTETVSAGGFKAGAYVSGQPVSEGPGKQITTAKNIQEVVASRHLHPIALFVAQDSCPPSNGCMVTPPKLNASGTPGALAWQYSQSPRRPEITRACMKTYAADSNCYVPELPGVFLDLDVAADRDPSHGR